MPSGVGELWVETWVRFSANFTTAAPAGWGCLSNPDYKMLFVRYSKSSRADLQPGTYGNSWTFGIGSDPQGNGGSPAGTIPGLPWDGQWHQYRLHVMFDRVGGAGHYTAGDLWIDGVLKKQFPGVADAASVFGTMYGLALGRNMNQGPDHLISVWWGMIRVYDADPGWGKR